MMLTENWVNAISAAIVAGSLARAWLITRHRRAKQAGDAGLSVTPRLPPRDILRSGTEIDTGGLKAPVQVLQRVNTLRFGSERRAS